MRRTALLEQRAARIIRCCTGCFLPESLGVQHVPLWNIAGPHTGKLKPGPSRGPVFYWARRSAKARDVLPSPRRLFIAPFAFNYIWKKVVPCFLPEKFLAASSASAPPWGGGLFFLSRGRVILGVPPNLPSRTSLPSRRSHRGKTRKTGWGTGRFASRCSSLKPAARLEIPAKSGISTPRAK